MSTNNISPLNKHLDDKFIAVIPIPKSLRSINTSGNDFILNNTVDVNTVQFAIKGFTLPSVSIPSATLAYKGQSLKISSHVRLPYEPISITIDIDSKMSNYWYFKEWLECMNSSKESYMAETNESEYVNFDYMADMSILTLDEYNNSLVRFDFTKSFPVYIGGIQYDYANGINVTTSITFDYSQFLMTPLDQDDIPTTYELEDTIII